MHERWRRRQLPVAANASAQRPRASSSPNSRIVRCAPNLQPGCFSVSPMYLLVAAEMSLR